jgi:hypothetical protein
VFPRNFNFDETGRWFVVGNQNSNELRVFEIDAVAGTLSATAHAPTPVPSPNYIGAMPIGALAEAEAADAAAARRGGAATAAALGVAAFAVGCAALARAF